MDELWTHYLKFIPMVIVAMDCYDFEEQGLTQPPEEEEEGVFSQIGNFIASSFSSRKDGEDIAKERLIIVEYFRDVSEKMHEYIDTFEDSTGPDQRGTFSGIPGIHEAATVLKGWF